MVVNRSVSQSESLLFFASQNFGWNATEFMFCTNGSRNVIDISEVDTTLEFLYLRWVFTISTSLRAGLMLFVSAMVTLSSSRSRVSNFNRLFMY
jgi:hypothetical protein